MYTEKDIICAAGRENNKKRNYLIVNKLQAKHIPVNPKKTLEMFNALASQVKKNTDTGKILVIGFAETATAIGAAAAIYLKSLYIQTTREQLNDAQFLYFSEEHSHATEQKLDKKSIGLHINEITRIIFAEDEVTTGNTILNAVKAIKKAFGDNIKFSVMSIINGMDQSSLERFSKENIDVHYLLKTDNSIFAEKAENFTYDGIVYEENETLNKVNPYFINENYINTRKVTDSITYDKSCRYLADEICRKINPAEGEKILVMGTEEFMYPAIYTGYILSENAAEVYCHSTTRSPISVSLQQDYPLYSRYKLKSIFDENRITYIYNLKKYDKVIIMTDSQTGYEKGLSSLIQALKQSGNEDISIFIWKEN